MRPSPPRRPAPLRAPLAPAAAATALLLLGCGEAGFAPDSLVFFRVDEASVEFGRCTDLAGFREQAGYRLPPLDGSAFFGFRVDGEGRSLEQVQCTGFTPATCSPLRPPMPLAISGPRAAGGGESRQTVHGACVAVVGRTLVLEERQGVMTLTQTDTYSLQEDPEDCAEFEAGTRADSDNDLGYQGCVVVRRLAGARL